MLYVLWVQYLTAGNYLKEIYNLGSISTTKILLNLTSKHEEQSLNFLSFMYVIKVAIF